MSSPIWLPLGIDPTSERGLWMLEETGATAFDSSAYKVNGTFTGGVTRGVAGAKAGSLCTQFDGSSGWVSLPASSSLNSIGPAWSLSAWVYATATRPTVSQAASILSKGFDSPNSGMGPLFLYGREGGGGGGGTINRVSIGFYNNVGGYKFATDPLDLDQNTWRHMVGTWDGTTLRLYRDGAEVANASGGGTACITSPMALQMGKWDAAAPGMYWPGRLDDVRIWARTLSPAEVLALYNAPVLGVALVLPPAFVPVS